MGGLGQGLVQQQPSSPPPGDYFAQNPKHRGQTEAIRSKSQSSGGPKSGVRREVSGPPCSKTAPRSHVTCKQRPALPGSSRLWGFSPHPHPPGNMTVAPSQAYHLPTQPPPHLPTQGTSESGSLTETWGAPSKASALPTAQLPRFLLGHRSRRPSWADLHPGILCFLPRFSPQRLHTPLLCVTWSHSLSQRSQSIRIWDGGRCPLPTSSQGGAATVPRMPAKTQNA